MSTRRANKIINLRRGQVSRGNSSRVASDAQATQWERNLEELMREISANDEHGYFNLYNMFRTTTVNLYQTYSDAIVNAAVWAAPGAAWPARPVRPNDLYLAHYNAIMAPIDAHDALMWGGGAGPPGAAPAAFDPTEIFEIRASGPTPAEFDQFKWDILADLAHSGFSSIGDHTQIIAFKVNDMPANEYEYHEVFLSEIASTLPTHMTFMKMGRYYANTIAQIAKDNDIMFDWGKNHGCPQSLNHLSFPCWDSVTDKRLLTDEMRRRMIEVTAIALRDKDRLTVEDPLAPETDTSATEFQVGYTAQRVKDRKRANERIAHARGVSFGGFTFPPSPTGGSSS